MAREIHGVDARAGDGLRILRRQDPLGDELSRPDLAKPGDVVDRDAGIEHAGHPLGGAFRFGRDHRELDRRGRQFVQPPPRVAGDLERRAPGELGRHDQAVPHVPIAAPGHRAVHGEHEGVEPRVPRPLHHRLTHGTIRRQVELEPPPGRRSGGSEVFDRRRAESRQCVGNVEIARDTRDGRLARGVHQPRGTGRGEEERQGRPLTEHLDRDVDVPHVAQHARLELQALEQLARTAHARLGSRPAIDEIEDHARHAPTGEQAYVGDIGAPTERPGRVGSMRCQVEQRRQFTPAQQASLHAGAAGAGCGFRHVDSLSHRRCTKAPRMGHTEDGTLME